jgi:hypothetical protein
MTEVHGAYNQTGTYVFPTSVTRGVHKCPMCGCDVRMKCTRSEYEKTFTFEHITEKNPACYFYAPSPDIAEQKVHVKCMLKKKFDNCKYIVADEIIRTSDGYTSTETMEKVLEQYGIHVQHTEGDMFFTDYEYRGYLFDVAIIGPDGTLKCGTMLGPSEDVTLSCPDDLMWVEYDSSQIGK